MNFPRNNLNNNNTKELTSSFSKIAESLKNFNRHNLKNNLRVLFNINQLIGIISTMLNDSNKKEEEKKEDNNSSNSMISYTMTIIEDLKNKLMLFNIILNFKNIYLVI